MDEINHRLLQVTAQLQAMGTTLVEWLAAEKATRPRLDAVRLKGLKSAVDDSRMLLWTIMDELTREDGVSATQAMLDIRIRRTLEMLHQLRPHLVNPFLLPTREGHILENEIKEIASEIRHRE